MPELYGRGRAEVEAREIVFKENKRGNNKMSMTNAEKIEEWRKQHPDTILNEAVLLNILGVDSLAGIDLSNAYLSNVYLRKANLQKTNLRNTCLWQANLQSVNLVEANLQDANLQETSLHFANLQKTNFFGANLLDSNLQNANLVKANLHHALLKRANLTFTELQETSLYCANLAQANLKHANLLRARLGYTTLEYANLAGTKTDGILQLTGVHEYQTIVLPTEQGWQINIGCWWGYLDELKKLIAQNAWVESKGEQVIKQRPYMENLIHFIESYIALKSAKDEERGL